MDFITFFHILIPAILIMAGLATIFFIGEFKRAKLQQRINKVTQRKQSNQKTNTASTLSLRRKSSGMSMPLVSKLLSYLPTQAAVQSRLERAGLRLNSDSYMIGSISTTILVATIMLVIHRPVMLALLAGFFIGIIVPHKVVVYLGNKRIKKFLTLFPDAIEFIVRGLRSGLPVTESMNMVGGEMEEPIGSIFASIGESVKLGVSVDKALADTAQKLSSTEFNFFVTSIILQRETGGNLSEILNNLADVLRKRFMMRMKIKAMSSEAKASAMIVGALPFLVMIALVFISPGYLDALFTDTRGNIALAGAATSLCTGVGIMVKMSRFEI